MTDIIIPSGVAAAKAAHIGPRIKVAEDNGLTALEMLFAKRISETLMKHYPGYLWAVDVSRSIVNIRCLDAHGLMGYTLHVPNEYSASEFDKRVVRAGGEILERFQLSRRRIDNAAIADMPTNFAGELHFQV